MQILDLSYAQIGLDPKTMAVHSGDFHADDVFAAALISMIYPKLKVIRTRNPDQFDTCDIVADVGLIHDPTKLRFDHHQEGRAGSRENGILYSGFGLVWQHWGLAVCKGNEDIFKSIDRKLVQPIDADDNGQELAGELNFKGVDELGIGKLIILFRPSVSEGRLAMEDGFTSATEQAKLILSRFLKKELELNELKQEIIEDYNQLEDGRFMVDEMHRPVLKFSKNLPELLFYVFPNEDGSMWMIKTTNIDGSKFESRCSLPAEWAGKNGAELEEVSGIEGFDFCHNSLFICGASSKEAILKALEKALPA